MTDDTAQRSAVWNVVAFLLCLALYVLSYAPVYRLVEGPDVAPPSGCFVSYLRDAFDQRPWEGIYVPVMLLIDHTPLDRPLLAWAEVWQVDERFCNGLLMRAIEREISRLEI